MKLSWHTTSPKNFNAWFQIHNSLKILEFLEKSEMKNFDFLWKIGILTYVNFNLNLMTKNTLISLNEVKLMQINNFQTNVGAFWTPKPTQLTVWVRFL